MRSPRQLVSPLLADPAHLDTGKNMIDVQRLKQGPHLKIDLGDAGTIKVHTGHDSFHDDSIVSTRGDRYVVNPAWSRSVMVQRPTHLTGPSVQSCQAKSLTACDLWRSFGIGSTDMSLLPALANIYSRSGEDSLA